MDKRIKKLVGTILITFGISLLTVWGYSYLLPAYQDLGVGAFTQLTSSDQLSAFPTTYNANLNKTIEVGTTSVASITTLGSLTTAGSLATIGTITTGTWNADTIAVAYGGTASTSLASNQVILGNGSSGFKVVNGFGSSGQFLTSNGAATAPTWQTSAVDQGLDYLWSGDHSFNNTSATTSIFHAFVAAGTSTSPWLLNGLYYRFPSSMSTTTVWSYDNNGTFNSDRYSHAVEVATTTKTFASSASEQELLGVVIPGGTLNPNGAIEAIVHVANYDCSSGNKLFVRAKYEGTTFASVENNCSGTTGGTGIIDVTLMSTSSAVRSGGFLRFDAATPHNNDYSNGLTLTSSTTVLSTADTNTDQDFKITVQCQTSSSNCGMTVRYWTIKAIR